jgi:hypothetical protein
MPDKRRKVSSWPLLVVGFGLLLILGAGGWYLYGTLNQAEDIIPTAQIEDSLPDIPRVGIGDAKAAYDTGSAVFVDVRGSDAFAQSHIVGALSIPLGELPDRMKELNPANWIITYCT